MRMGKYEKGRVECIDCAKGQFQELTGNDTCIACPLGYIASEKGSEVCSICLPGTFESNQVECVMPKRLLSGRQCKGQLQQLRPRTVCR